MAETELKPCPFCGCEKVLTMVYDPFDGYQGSLAVYRIRCRNCGAQIERNDVVDAIKAWNRRTGNG